MGGNHVGNFGRISGFGMGSYLVEKELNRRQQVVEGVRNAV